MKNFFNLKLAGLGVLMVLFTLQLSAQRPQGGQRQGGGPGGQGRGNPMTEEDIRERVDKLSETLDLADDQQKKIMNHELEFYTKMQVEREKNMGDREAMRASMTEAREARDKKYKEVLTEDQYKQYKEIEEKRREQRRQQNQNRDSQGGGERPERGRGRN